MIRSILGPNSYMARARLNELLDGIDEASIERVDGVDIDIKSLDVLVRSQSLFSSPTVVVSNVSEQKSVHDDFMQLVEDLGEDTELIIYEPAVDKRSKYYKFLLKNTECDEYKQLDPNELINWIIEEAKNRNTEIDRSSARYLAERIGEDQWRISNELDKLLMSNQAINRQLIDELVEPTPNESIFKLLDLVLSGSADRAVEQYDKLVAQKMEPAYILSMLTWQLHILALMVFAKNRTPEEVAKDAKVSPFVAKKTAQIAKNVNRTQLKYMLEESAKFDSDMKSKSIDSVEAMRQLIIKLCKA